MTVTIQRKFQEISESQLSGEIPDEYDFGIPIASVALDWNDLKAIPLVVLVAPAGAGKTYECRQQNDQLRLLGYSSFFINLVDLSASELEGECLDFCVQGGFQGGSQSRLPFVYRGLKINDQRLRGTLSRRHKCAKRGECGAPSGGFHHTLHHSIALVNRSPNSRANCGMADDHLVLARVQVSV